ncbi:protein of unknown function [Cupriavidus taiwanensis]|uniref:Uncharacterized protein n=1 Tax=Cupriavidus taiwanensis TaxID=164546 RepID=A0A375IIV5_9BURK|nr:protein of unknown function [Cupriavidus taiwanensis]
MLTPGLTDRGIPSKRVAIVAHSIPTCLPLQTHPSEVDSSGPADPKRVPDERAAFLAQVPESPQIILIGGFGSQSAEDLYHFSALNTLTACAV